MDYILPFDVEKYGVHILQGYHGPYSHFDHEERYGVLNDQSYAVDFILPLGTEIFSSRGGCVIGFYTISNTFYEGIDVYIGNNLPSFSTNFLVIMHDDDSCALYSHLWRQSERVVFGQRVEPGIVLAHSGKSGWIGPNPHLHFAVYRYVERSNRRNKIITEPASFRNYHGPLEHAALTFL